ncbi:Uncharacterized protein YqgQ [Evansella caseinilytica]|uniref:Uncharacterized protein YqgQ n=1 Tax=Evansella caseinilytica TaxID=1503961 RepID=A0A1H3KQP1_9BACI|nr:YqgQ family protein [Evansella caseinilytica]SDY54497.1 Uncharacterized protein YqgQ [Evansella caseinilytica]
MTFYDLQQMLKKFGTIIYTGTRIGDLDLMEEELKELYRLGIIDPDVYRDGLLVVKNERQAEISKNNVQK